MSEYDNLISSLNYDNRVLRSDGVMGTITQVYADPKYSVWCPLEWTDALVATIVTEDNASGFTLK
jgi:hypothetical protein